MENEKWKMENDCVRFAHDLKLFPKEIPQFSIFNFQFSIAKQLDKLKFEVSAAGDRSKIIHILQSCGSCGKISANVPK